MGTIKNIFGMSPDINKTNRNNTEKKVNTNNKEQETGSTTKTGNSHKPAVTADISPVGRELLTLKSEAASYIEEVRSAKTITTTEIQEIKEKIASQYYFEPEVIDQIVDKLMAMPSFVRRS